MKNFYTTVKSNLTGLALATLLTFNFALSTLNLNASTTIPGTANLHGHWTLAGSPYNITGSVIIPSDSTLTIDPGVTVSFQTASHLKMLVNGRLLAVGTASQNIYFTAANTTTGFGGIRFNTLGAINDTSKFIYCNIQYGIDGIAPYINGGALYFNNWSKVIISHCTIKNCQATNGKGGAIYCSSSSPVITYNTISNNATTTTYGNGTISCDSSSNPVISYNTISNNNISNYGGGISCESNSNPLISYNTISGNTCGFGGGSNGGGIYCSYAGITTISNNTITNNTANYNSGNYQGGNGGGIYCDNNSTTLTISDNIITGNTAGILGGGISCYGNVTAILSNNTISGNSAAGTGGGGIFCYYSTVSISNTTITNNTTVGSGGGIYCGYGTINSISHSIISGNSSVTDGGGIWCGIYYGIGIISSIDNTLISNNSANAVSGNGGGIYLDGGAGANNPAITNVTLTNNDAFNGGGMYFMNTCNPVLDNCILWGNIDSGLDQVFLFDQQSSPAITYSDVQGGIGSINPNGNFYTGIYTNNISGDPLFVNPSPGSGSTNNGAYDWTFLLASPCRNTGDAAGTYPSTDLAGNNRVYGGRIDMGAYEYEIGVTMTHTNVLCHGNNTATATATGINGNPNYTYSWNTVPVQTIQTATGLIAGTYTVTVHDASSASATASVTITQPAAALTLSMSKTNASCANNDGVATVAASGGRSPYYYRWSNNDSTATITGISLGIYSVTVTDTNGCIAHSIDTIAINGTAPPLAPSICEVTMDSVSGTNQYIDIYWDKTVFAGNIDSVFIYRYSVTSAGYLRLGAVPNNSSTLSRFTDTERNIDGPHGGDPTYTYYQYKIAVHDTCGNTSAMSLYHESCNFNYISGTLFQWNLYTIENSPPIQGYQLWKDSLSNHNWQIVTSAVGTNANDPYYSSSDSASYRVEALGFNCAATRASISTTHSNIKHNALATGIANPNLNNEISIFPNPANETVTIDVSSSKFKVSSLKVYNVMGEVVYQSLILNPKTLIDISNFAKGIYTVVVESDKGNVFKKLIKE